MLISFNGHRSAITALAFDDGGVRLASGSKDTDIIIWDLVAETGLFKLRGHKDQVTALHLLQPSEVQNQSYENKLNGHDVSDDVVRQFQNNHPGFLLSTSKDALIKIWDLGSQHCIETHVAQTSGECWAMGISADASGCITAGKDRELKCWSIDIKGLAKLASQIDEGSERAFLREKGILYREGRDRTLGVTFHSNGNYIAVHGSENAVELWRIRSEAEVQKSLARKRKRRREKGLSSGDQEGTATADLTNGNDSIQDISAADISEVIVPYVKVRTSGKIHSVAWVEGRANKAIQLLIATANNQLELYNITAKPKVKASKPDEIPDYSRSFSVDLPGHRENIRSMSLSSDDRMLASASNGQLKIWNVRTRSCIRTLECGYALCVAFLPGDKIVVVGNRNGELEVFDIASSTLIQSVKAHDGLISTIHVHPDGKSLATGSADKSAKFFSFEVVQEEIPGTRRTTSCFRLVHAQTLKVTDEILSLRFSPDSRLIALSLLDYTVKVFFVDSLKLFLNLYGHKLPVLSMDISYDSKLIVTSSADKNVRLWGLDFGDCHKAFFAHQDSIMQVAFVPHNQDLNGHHFFSASKDRMIKYWDGDKFEQIQKLSGHHGEIRALVVSRTGDFIVSTSHDKSIRVWQQTDEHIFLEEEREKELEELYEKTLVSSLEHEEETGAEKAEVAAAGKQTNETLMAGERIAEALEIGIADLEVVREWKHAKASQPNLAPPDRDLTFLAFGNISAEVHVLNVVQKVKPAALQDALLVLPFAQVTSLFTFLQIWAENRWKMPLTCRILFFMLKTYHSQIVASKTMRPMLDGIRQHLRKALQQQKDEMGFNLAALKFVGTKVKERGTKNYIDEAIWEEEEARIEKGRKKRAFIDIA